MIDDRELAFDKFIGFIVWLQCHCKGMEWMKLEDFARSVVSQLFGGKRRKEGEFIIRLQALLGFEVASFNE